MKNFFSFFKKLERMCLRKKDFLYNKKQNFEDLIGNIANIGVPKVGATGTLGCLEEK